MRCDQVRESILDVLYGEDVTMEESAAFFRHIDDCRECGREYSELLGTREVLSTWTVEEEFEVREAPSSLARLRSMSVWNLVARVAAIFLVVVGAISLLQHAGLWPDRHVVVSETQMAEMVHDMILAGQEENWRVIGRALLEARDEMEMRDRRQIQLVDDQVEGLEMRFVNALEETNRQVRTLLETGE